MQISPIARAILLAAENTRDPIIPFRSLPPVVQSHIEDRVRFMAAEEKAATFFDTELVAQNPAPKDTRNHWAWRATGPVLHTLRVPRFALEASLVWLAYPTRDLSRMDVGSIVLQLRAESHSNNLIEFVGTYGIPGLMSLVQKTLSRVS